MSRSTLLLGALLLITSTVAVLLFEENQGLKSQLYSERLIKSNLAPIISVDGYDVVYSNVSFDGVAFNVGNNTTYRFYNARINNSTINKVDIYDSYIENSTVTRANIKGHIGYSNVTDVGICGFFENNSTIYGEKGGAQS